MPTKRKPTSPEPAVGLKIVLALEDGTEVDGRRRYYCTVPGFGSPDFCIWAKNAKEAGKTLANYVFNELDGADPITADD